MPILCQPSLWWATRQACAKAPTSRLPFFVGGPQGFSCLSFGAEAERRVDIALPSNFFLGCSGSNCVQLRSAVARSRSVLSVKPCLSASYPTALLFSLQLYAVVGVTLSDTKQLIYAFYYISVTETATPLFSVMTYSAAFSARASNINLKATAREPAPPTPCVRSATAPSSSSSATAVSDGDLRNDDGDGDDDKHDEDDVFEDPAVERERRRKHSRRRQRKKRHLQQQPPPSPLEQRQGGVVGKSADVGGGESGSCTRGFGQKPGDDPVEMVCFGSAEAAVETPPITESRAGAGDCQVDEDVDCLGKGRASCPAAGSAAASATAASTTTAAAVAASTVAAISETATCEGLAELSEVPDLLKDDSIGAVVTAVAVGRGGAGMEQDGAGVPEMSIVGRRLNKEVRALSVTMQ